MPGTLGHLSSRFFEVLTSRPLDAVEEAMVESWLPAALATVFFDQPHPDQRHGYEAGLYVMDRDHREDVLVAAMMHDAGKRHSGLGVLGRVAASLSAKLGLPMTQRMRLYRDHGMVGARELAERGAPGLAVDFALHHHGERPSSIDPGTWDLLTRADTAKPTRRGGGRIFSGIR